MVQWESIKGEENKWLISYCRKEKVLHVSLTHKTAIVLFSINVEFIKTRRNHKKYKSKASLAQAIRSLSKNMARMTIFIWVS